MRHRNTANTHDSSARTSPARPPADSALNLAAGARWKDCLPARSIPAMGGCENSRAVQCLWWRRQYTRRQGGWVVRWLVAIAVAAAALLFSTTALALLRWRCCSCSAAPYGTATVAGVHDSTARCTARHGVQYVQWTVQRVTGEYRWSTGGCR